MSCAKAATMRLPGSSAGQFIRGTTIKGPGRLSISTSSPQHRALPRQAIRPCAQAFGGSSKGANDPFAAKTRERQAAAAGPEGFRRPGSDPKDFMKASEADQLLQQYDTDCKAAVERNQSGLGYIPPAKEAELLETHPGVRAACESLASQSSTVMMGICAGSAAEGVQTLKAWVGGMGLPRGRLHGMDKNGVAVPVKGAVFIKFNSLSGDADLSGYAGSFRGVLFTPTLADGNFRQYGYLPLATFQDEK